MAITDFSGDYLNFDGTQDSEIWEITSECKLEFSKQLNKSLWNVRVKNGEIEKTFSPNLAQGKSLQETFGKESKDWIGKKFQIIHVEGKMVIRPIKN